MLFGSLVSGRILLGTFDVGPLCALGALLSFAICAILAVVIFEGALVMLVGTVGLEYVVGLGSCNLRESIVMYTPLDPLELLGLGGALFGLLVILLGDLGVGCLGIVGGAPGLRSLLAAESAETMEGHLGCNGEICESFSFCFVFNGSCSSCSDISDLRRRVRDVRARLELRPRLLERGIANVRSLASADDWKHITTRGAQAPQGCRRVGVSICYQTCRCVCTQFALKVTHLFLLKCGCT